jgi:hypothetical protein
VTRAIGEVKLAIQRGEREGIITNPPQHGEYTGG